MYEEGYRCEEVVSEDLMVFSHDFSCELHNYWSPKTKLSDVIIPFSGVNIILTKVASAAISSNPYFQS